MSLRHLVFSGYQISWREGILSRHVNMWPHSFTRDTTHTYVTWRVPMRHDPLLWDTPNSYESSVMSHMNESCHIWTSHATYWRVMSPMNESCHIWMSHATWIRHVTSHINTQVWTSHVTHEWVMSHMNVSCHVWINPFLLSLCPSLPLSHTHTIGKPRWYWTSPLTIMAHMDESCPVWIRHITYEQVTSCTIDFSLSLCLSLSLSLCLSFSDTIRWNYSASAAIAPDP